MRKNTFRRVISIVVVMLLFATVLLPVASAWQAPPKPEDNNIPFEDVPRGRWDYETVSWAWLNNIISGKSQTRFAPGDNITRAEFVTILNRIWGRPQAPANPTRTFSDVNQGHWWWHPVMWAANRPTPIVEGISGTTRFEPNTPISRQEMVVMLRRAAGQTGAVTPPGALNRFPDRTQVSTFAIPAMEWAADLGIIGAGGVLNPRGNATRSEALVMIRRVANEFRWTLQNPWSSPVRDVPRMPQPAAREIDPMDPIRQFRPSLVANTPITEIIPPGNAGTYRFVLTGLTQVNGSVRIQIIRTPYGDGDTIRDWTTLRFQEGLALNLTGVEHHVRIEPLPGTTGPIELSVLAQKPIHDLVTTPQITYVTDFIEFIGQHNDYRLTTPASTGTGLPSGMYRFDFPTLATADGVRATVDLTVLLERYMTPVAGPFTLAWGEGVNVRLDDNQTYIIRVNHVPIANSAGTVISRTVPYTLRIGAQKVVFEDLPMRNNDTLRQLRVSLVNDEFQFIGQQNTYLFTAPTDGFYEFRPNLLPEQSHVLMRVSDPWGNVVDRTVGVRDGITIYMQAGARYRLHITHIEGINQLGKYSFTIVYP